MACIHNQNGSDCLVSQQTKGVTSFAVHCTSSRRVETFIKVFLILQRVLLLLRFTVL